MWVPLAPLGRGVPHHKTDKRVLVINEYLVHSVIYACLLSILKGTGKKRLVPSFLLFHRVLVLMRSRSVVCSRCVI